MDYKRVALNGTWQLQPGMDIPERFDYHIAVPALVDVAEPALNWSEHNFFWYHKSFKLTPSEKSDKIILQIEQVKYGTQVWINGHNIGSDIACYTSQEFDLTPYIRFDAENELLVRVGRKESLPEHSAVGSDFEKISWIPGIWGDVWLHLYGGGRVNWTRINSDITDGTVDIYSEIESWQKTIKQPFRLRYVVREKESQRIVAESPVFSIEVSKKANTEHFCRLRLKGFQLWSPEKPFLYELEVELRDSKGLAHRRTIPFGLREFAIRNGSFYLNGRRRVLLGSNIPFHRMLSDTTRGLLPWDTSWIRKALVEIPKAHNMFFFRFHLGHAYNKWYDIADEGGILLQDEWMFWTSGGSRDQIRKEFTAWIRENINHPSIVIWDPLNESEDEWITGELIPELKKIDPDRPWEMVDFGEDHPYIYSLGPVLNGEKFGFSRSVFDLQKSKQATMINEYIWWWLDREGNPTPLTQIVVERWLGNSYNKDALLEHQAFLAQELTELWRRLDIDAILPFVYLSVGEGATANWFFGPLKDLRPKPVLSALKNAFAPLGVSLELWDRHFLISEQREIPLYLFNDTNKDARLTARIVLSGIGEECEVFRKTISAAAGRHVRVSAPIIFPQWTGKYDITATLEDQSGRVLAYSRKPAFVFAAPSIPPDLPKGLVIHDPHKEITDLFEQKKLKFHTLNDPLNGAQVVLINHSGLDSLYAAKKSDLSSFVRNGGVLIIQEAEYGVKEEREVSLLDDLSVHIVRREDRDRGGYDSYVFKTDNNHPLWRGIEDDHLKMFNGALGGEIVSQHNLHPTRPFHAAAVCNLSLKVPAVLEIPYGKGWVVLSRIQVRGRLRANKSSAKGLYERRYDPVAENYLYNLLCAYLDNDKYFASVRQQLNDKKIYIARARTSSGQIYDALDGKFETRWSSDASDPQWAWIDLGRPTELNRIIFHWETAYGKEYKISISDDNTHWETVYKEDNSDGAKDVIDLHGIRTRYLKIDFIQRGTRWGYSIWELELD